MFKTNVGYSVNEDALLSGKETATSALNGLDAKLGLLFTSCVQDQEKILEGVKSVKNDLPVIGCTSSAAIVVSNVGYLGNETGYSGMMAFGGDSLTVGVAGCAKDDRSARDIGKALAREAIKNAGVTRVPNYFFMVASPKEEEDYIKGIQDVVGRIPMFGGSCADNTVEGKWSIFCGDKVFADGCAIAFFFSNNEMKNAYTGAYKETKNVGVITKVRDKRTLVEIDNVPALEKYASWTGKDVNTLVGGNLLVESILAPLGVKDPQGDVLAVRHPMAGNEDHSLNVGANLAEGTAVIQLEGTVDTLINSNTETLKKLNGMMKNDVESYFLVHCGGRRLGIALAGRENEIYDAAMKGANGKPFLMVFTFGEYGSCDHSANTVGGLSLSFTAFSDVKE